MKQAWHTPVCQVLSLITAITIAMVTRDSTAQLDTLTEELADGCIVDGLRGDPLFGDRPTLDASKLRLPMYIDTIWGGCFGRSPGVPSRGLSLFVGVVTICATAGLACSLFGLGTGFLSAVILSISPYFLAYSRVAMTEGDVFSACFITLAMWSYVAYLRSPTPGRWLLSAVLFGCAVGTTILAIYLVVVYWLLSATTYSEPAFKLSRMPDHTRRLHRLLAWQVGVVIVTSGIAILDRYPPDQLSLSWLLPHARTAAIIGWVALLTLWLATAAYVIVVGVLSRSREERFRAFVVFAFCTVFAIMPAHLLDPSISKELIVRTVKWDGGVPFGFVLGHLRLYSGILLLKMTLPLGIVTVAALLYGAFNERNNGRWRPCVFAVLLFLAMLCAMPSRHSQNLMAVYPMISIVAAAGLAGITRRVRDLRSGPITAVWLLASACAVGYLGFETWRTHPHYQLYGADLLASRFEWKWLGKEARGNRNLIQTSADGVESLVEWCESSESVKPGSRIVSYLWDEAIVQAMLPKRSRYTMILRGVSAYPGETLPPRDIANADFVLLHVTNFVGYNDRAPDLPPLDELNEKFKPIFTVKRGDMEIAWVYGKKL